MPLDQASGWDSWAKHFSEKVPPNAKAILVGTFQDKRDQLLNDDPSNCDAVSERRGNQVMRKYGFAHFQECCPCSGLNTEAILFRAVQILDKEMIVKGQKAAPDPRGYQLQ